MPSKKSKRKQAIARRNAFLALCCIVLIAILAAVIYFGAGLVSKLSGDDNKPNPSDASVPNSPTSSDVSPGDDPSSNTESGDTYDPDKSRMVDVNGVQLDANFRRVLLINGDNPLPDNYDADIRQHLVEVNPKYRNNDYVKELHKDIIPYVEAMVARAQSEGVDLRVWSPFRSYSIQNTLFQNQVEKMKAKGYSGKAAEDKAATVVARPGTSEHNTGLCADFNMASDKFESTKMYEWMCENAEDYGFILRYPKDKTDITGVIYESWHWRFVGIDTAKEMNKLGLTLEEYFELKHFNNTDEIKLTGVEPK